MTRRGMLLIGLSSLALLGSAQAAAAASLSYFGGPVAHSMNVVLVKWGPSVRSTYADPSSGDPAFFQYLSSQSGSTSDIGGVLAQYMDSSGQNSANRFGYAGAVQITPSSSATTVDDSTIQSELQSKIASSTLPAPAGDGMSTIYVVLFPLGDNVCQGGTCSTGNFCAYHGSFPLTSSTHVLYAAMVDNGPTSPNAGGCGNNPSDINNQTSVTSHEFSETINDPLVAEVTGNGPPLAWYNLSQGEIGDICNGLQAANGPWTVQRIWSNLDGTCEASEPSFLAPTAAFTGPSSAGVGQALSFDATGSADPSANHASLSPNSIVSGIAGYDWNWGDGSAHGTGPTAGHAYSAAGTWPVSLSVTDNMGFTSTVTHAVVVSGSSSPPPGAPTAATAAPSSVGGSTATVAGTVNPHGALTAYHFEFGTTTAYGHSSAATSAGAGTSSLPVAALLTGLTPRSLYHYRLIASSAAGTAVGADRTFTTGAPPPKPPRFSFRVVSGRSLRGALGHGLAIKFTCSATCTARFTVTVALPGITQAVSTPVTVARGQRRLASGGPGRITVTFPAKSRRRLGRRSSLKLLIAGYAVGRAGSTSVPKAARLTLRG